VLPLSVGPEGGSTQAIVRGVRHRGSGVNEVDTAGCRGYTRPDIAFRRLEWPVKRFLATVCVAALVFGTSVLGQETIPPIQVGGGASGSRVANGQTVQVISEVPVTVYFTEISSVRVTGVASRSCSGTCSGTVTIRWIETHRETSLSLGPIDPDVPFGMENGDVDKRTYNDVN
jgi:hypothetical protein